MKNTIAAQEQTGVFERKEKKFVLTRDVLDEFLNAIHTYLIPDERGITRVSSLYYDTPENTLISRSLEKPVYKEKLRIRAYGEVNENSEVFVELKKKFKGIVYKRRFSCPLSDAEAFFTTPHVILRSTECDEGTSQQGVKDETLSQLQTRPFASRGALAQGDVGGAEVNQVAGEPDVNRSATSGPSQVELEDRNYLEVKACRDRYQNLQPKMLIVTNRLALYTNDGSDIRLTIDFDPMFDNKNLSLDNHGSHKRLIDKDQCILEIKSAGALPMWMIEQMSKLQIRPQSFSKYGEAFKRSKQIGRKSNVSGSAPKHANYKEVACV